LSGLVQIWTPDKNIFLALTPLMGACRVQKPIVRTCPNFDPRQKYFSPTSLMGCWSGQSPMPRTCPNFDPQPKKKKFFFLSSHFTAGLLARETAAAPDSVKKGWYRLKRENMKHKNYEKCVLHRAYAVATVPISNGSTVPLSTQYLQLYSIYSIHRCASVSTELNLFFKHRQLWQVVSTHSWNYILCIHTY
jgi:hypothetical protein